MWKSKSNLIDAHLHIGLGAAYGAIFAAVFAVFPDLVAAALSATFTLYIREVTQVQSKRYDNVIWYGWGLDSLGSHAEWIYPGTILTAIAVLRSVS